VATELTGSLNLKPYSTICNVAIMHEENAVSLVETEYKRWT